jgi:hypothetical protein
MRSRREKAQHGSYGAGNRRAVPRTQRRLRTYSGRSQATGLVPERTSRPGSADVASPKR